MKYIPLQGDILHYEDRAARYAQEYDGTAWTKPAALSDIAIDDAALYVRIIGPRHYPERYTVMHSLKKQHTTYYRVREEN